MKPTRMPKKTCDLSLQAIYERFAEGDHSIFSPSASSRWMNCPGSLIPNLLAPDDTGIFAAEGTVAHELAEQWLNTGKKPKHRLGEWVWIENGTDWFEIQITRGMFIYVEEYVDICMMTPGEKFIESRVDFSMLTPVPGQKGTLDFCAIDDDTLYIRDLKYGKGVKVDAVKNSQLLIYAYAKYMEIRDFYYIKRIVICIVQPRLDHVEEWECTPEELMGFGELVKRKAAEAWNLNAPLVAGVKQCGFCRIRQTCPARLAMARQVLELRFPEDGQFPITEKQVKILKEDLDEDLFFLNFQPPMSLNNAQLASVLKYRTTIENWFKSLQTELTRRAMAGETIPGYKLVEGRSFRSFEDNEKAEKALLEAGLTEEDIWKVDIISPAVAEEALMATGLKRKELPAVLNPIVKSTKGAATLAPLTDKRPEIGSDVRSAMNDEDDDYFTSQR